jgi:hypothetical protein
MGHLALNVRQTWLLDGTVRTGTALHRRFRHGLERNMRPTGKQDFASQIKQPLDAVVSQAVEHEDTVFAIGDHTLVPQDHELLRNVWLALFQNCSQVTDAALPLFTQDLQNAEASGVR